MNKFLKIVFMMLLIGFLTACGMNNKDNVANDNGTNKTTENTNTVDEGNDGNISDNHDVNDNGDVNNANGTDRQIKVSDEVANKITELEGVNSASVLVTDHNAYVAVELKEGTNETEELKTKISDAAKAQDASLNNVYVSANPDFTKQFKEYGERVRANEPVEGFFDEFTDTVKRVFPDAK
ncbi:sporulation lipoprotein, YhcN/YlaJ family [Psychrobacillus sp. OK028]|uniref:YhcN/YlaJ family sporulation lipoprotein n=1 Tax=Psychrobacillus sp. OK028 TaxID=1884359 RepID=UPI00088C5F2F|nr:YhcN/YlaJ family sporulation lipoprotein [Psychrobacillus sp. OK028]SDN56706.1 sporulation lipoprotein, YhcN/YlaJ family [Psychrobacillus sp. OK028]